MSGHNDSKPNTIQGTIWKAKMYKYDKMFVDFQGIKGIKITKKYAHLSNFYNYFTRGHS